MYALFGTSDKNTEGHGITLRSSLALSSFEHSNHTHEVTLTDEAEVVVHEGADGEDVGGVDAGADDLEADLVVLLDDHVLLGRLVAGRVRVGVEGHVGGDGVARDEAGQRADLGEEAHLVHLQTRNVDAHCSEAITFLLKCICSSEEVRKPSR